MIAAPRKIAAILVAALGLLMAAMLAHGFANGGGWDEVARLARLPWGAATFVDVYVGLLLFSGWVIAREKSRAAGIAWALAILLGGNLIACLYALRVLLRGESPPLPPDRIPDLPRQTP